MKPAVLMLGVAVFAASGNAVARPRCLTRSHVAGARLSRVPGLVFGGGRPRAAVTVASSAGRAFLVHGPAGMDAYLRQIRDAMDHAWREEIELAGWPAPPPDSTGPDSRYDVYVDESLGQDEAYTEPEEDITSTAWDDSASFIGLPDSFSDDQILVSTVAHELNHASQFAIDTWEDDAFFEQTAVFVERIVGMYYPSYGTGIDTYQANMDFPIDYFDGDYEYGSAVWLMFLAEHYDAGGQGLVQALWNQSKQSTSDNEPDYIDVLPGLLAQRGANMTEAFATLGIWRYFTGPRDDGNHFQDGAIWGRRSQAAVRTAALGAGPLMLGEPLGAFGGRLFEVDTGPVRRIRVVTSLNPPAAAGILSLDSPGSPIHTIAPGTMDSVTLASARVLVAVVSLPDDYDPDDDDWSTASVSVTLSADSTPPPDAGFPASDATVRDSGPSRTDAALANDTGIEDVGMTQSPDAAAGDAGLSDAAARSDAGTSGGGAGGGGGGSRAVVRDGDCGCSSVARGRSWSSWWLVAFGVLALTARRRPRLAGRWYF